MKSGPPAKTELFLFILNRACAVFTLQPRSLFQPFHVDKRKGNLGINNKALTESLPLFATLFPVQAFPCKLVEGRPMCF